MCQHYYANALQVLIQSIVTITLWNRYYYYPHNIKEATEIQKHVIDQSYWKLIALTNQVLVGSNQISL